MLDCNYAKIEAVFTAYPQSVQAMNTAFFS